METKAKKKMGTKGRAKASFCFDLVVVVQVLNECSIIVKWLTKKKQHQDSLPKHVDPVLLSADIKKGTITLDRKNLSRTTAIIDLPRIISMD
ncbi:hypothetical protein E3N88_25830 [Mikania micrantha]|uniref:Uncharacterized protein n=1 Tax=Mikania micrantha TaxID=192012 RepID=A0A5N6N8L4_9ASTR|nr:hypothetical protein E3N88_25830 [Mikania micrantha]